MRYEYLYWREQLGQVIWQLRQPARTRFTLDGFDPVHRALPEPCSDVPPWPERDSLVDTEMSLHVPTEGPAIVPSTTTTTNLSVAADMNPPNVELNQAPIPPPRKPSITTSATIKLEREQQLSFESPPAAITSCESKTLAQQSHTSPSSLIVTTAKNEAG
ncbi:unnamed protein product [Linum trigynum]|uniref:Uncharacterized protein n=1 Tax=Linum trigynum TaxID=586398 RepID=A0AAV2GJF9_9ROSI